MYYIIDNKTGSQQPCAVVPRVTIRNLREVFSTLDKGVEPCVAHAAFPVYGQINVYGVTTKSERHKRSYWTRTADGNGIGGRKAPVPYGS